MGSRSVHTLDKRKANYHLHRSLPFLEKWPQEPETGKACRNGTRISVWKFWPGKQTTFLLIDPKSHVPFTLQPDFFKMLSHEVGYFARLRVCERVSLANSGSLLNLTASPRYDCESSQKFPQRHKSFDNFLSSAVWHCCEFLLLLCLQKIVPSEAGRSTYPSHQNLLYQ